MSTTVPPAFDKTLERHLDALIRDVSDFPKPGVVFKDMTPLFADHDALAAVITALASFGRDADGNVVVDKIVGMEARGFILASPVAFALGAGFVPVRKAGKLPGPTYSVEYSLEYGQATLEIHRDAIAEGERVLMIDDVLATGGTVAATAQLIEQCGGVVAGVAVLMELSFLGGRETIGDVPLAALRTV